MTNHELGMQLAKAVVSALRDIKRSEDKTDYDMVFSDATPAEGGKIVKMKIRKVV